MYILLIVFIMFLLMVFVKISGNNIIKYFIILFFFIKLCFVLLLNAGALGYICGRLYWSFVSDYIGLIFLNYSFRYGK